jgi:hypothetical protein
MTDRPQQYPPSIELLKLWAKVSAKTGNTYFVGRLAGARVTVLPNTRKDDTNTHDYVVLLSQADPPSTKPQAPNPTDAPSLPLSTPAQTRPAANAYPARRPDDRGKKRVAGGGKIHQIQGEEIPFGSDR